MLKGFQKLWGRLNKIPTIRSTDFRPQDFQMNAYDIGKVYHLNQWFQKTTPKNVSIYKIQGEHLHREYLWSSFQISFRRGLIVLIIMLIMMSYYEGRKENDDFMRYSNIQNELGIYSDLTNGGYEFGDQ